MSGPARHIGVVATFSKENEKRVPIHPAHFGDLAPELRKRLIFETGYGDRFGISDAELTTKHGFRVGTRVQVMQSDVVVMAKPEPADMRLMADGAVLFGWPHCVQQWDITQIAIDKRLTLIAFEAMHEWSRDGRWMRHTFNRNNEMAGYCGVHHAMGLLGWDGSYGPKRKAFVIGHGSVAQGAILALRARGITDITAATDHAAPCVPLAGRYPGVHYIQFARSKSAEDPRVEVAGANMKMIDVLSEADVIVNGILQDTDDPLMFVGKEDEPRLKAGCLILDISCDEGMAFHFASPTSFNSPVIKRPRNVTYYAVDHTPSYLWQSASFEISTEVVRRLPIVAGGSIGWPSDETIRRSIEIQGGEIANPKILTFQRRSERYPHSKL
eukprot:Hpha_TRINITY_DN16202_c2_g3::TRINITY_DN16202_c2_g3_i1::g.11320::m.11320